MSKLRTLCDWKTWNSACTWVILAPFITLKNSGLCKTVDRQILALKVYQMPCEIYLIALVWIHLFVSPYALPGCLAHREPLAWSCARNTLLLVPGTGCVGREDMLEFSFIAEIPSSHNSFLKTLTGSIIQSSPQDALSYTRGAAWQQARRGEGVSVLVCLLPLNERNPALPLGLFSNTSHTTQAVCFRDFTHQWNFRTILFQKEPFLIESTTVSTPPVFWKGLSC